jgi:hypothetical protein
LAIHWEWCIGNKIRRLVNFSEKDFTRLEKFTIMRTWKQAKSAFPEINQLFAFANKN